MDEASTNSGESSSSPIPSVLIASVIAIAMALLVMIVFVLAQIAVCKCYQKFTPGGGRAEWGASAEGHRTEQEKKMKPGIEQEQKEPGGGGRRKREMKIQGSKSIKLQNNEAYATFKLQNIKNHYSH